MVEMCGRLTLWLVCQRILLLMKFFPKNEDNKRKEEKHAKERKRELNAFGLDAMHIRSNFTKIKWVLMF